jgi:hypothetical protein
VKRPKEEIKEPRTNMDGLGWYEITNLQYDVEEKGETERGF